MHQPTCLLRALTLALLSLTALHAFQLLPHKHRPANKKDTSSSTETTDTKAEAAKPATNGAQAPAAGSWTFAVSGDSRNCGDIVMPSIATSVRAHGAQFYWHLGDFRAIYTFDEDMQRAALVSGGALTVSSYLSNAWNDFEHNQLSYFDNLPVFLGIGNHELIPPQTRSQFLIQFADWLDSPPLKEQRLKDDPNDHALRTYYHWRRDGIEFINMDNASADQFDDEQMTWLRKVLAKDTLDGTVRALVVGMHEALPDSLADSHSMSQSFTGQSTGRYVYQALLSFRDATHIPVYLLASHSHFVLEDAFNSDYLQKNGGVLPGWIVGSAGAVRYPLPALSSTQKVAKTHVYGYLLATVSADTTKPIQFAFQEITEADVLADVKTRYSADGVHWCFDKN